MLQLQTLPLQPSWPDGGLMERDVKGIEELVKNTRCPLHERK